MLLWSVVMVMLLAAAIPARAQYPTPVVFDSCSKFSQKAATASAMALVRVQQPAEFEEGSDRLTAFFTRFFKAYLQKAAGGKIRLSLLIDASGRCCLHRVDPNTNVHPNYQELKQQLEQTRWIPARHQGTPVAAAKLLMLEFHGKKLTVTALD